MAEAMLLFFALLFEALRRVLFGRVSAVPVSVAEARVVAERVHPVVVDFRRRAYRRQVLEMRRHLARHHGVAVRPAPLRPFDFSKTEDAVLVASGLKPRGGVRSSRVDAESRRRERERVVVPSRRESVERFVEDLAKILERHVQNGAREAVQDSADANNVVELGSRRRGRRGSESVTGDDVQNLDDFEDGVKGKEDYLRELEEDRRAAEEGSLRSRRGDSGPRGVVVGWARVLAGETNCAFCAMLASRGPVYRSGLTAGFEAHDNCDCQMVMVVKGEHWPGEEQYAELKRLWRDARDRPSDYERGRMERGQLDSPFARFRSRFRQLSLSGESFKPDGVRRAERLISVRRAGRERGA